ncbi:uncharacterized protein LOC121694860 isoform X2 [Alosa sapidissima]|uniref:uncharacterized protein LOC121694860 isoform X2 n=1 Tax=Alosa sapidissima TaxID=34773 RepID=UPI001C09331C|nr:uncharacterized protein LOC121694860 isoform X2 [Alosa sapidissima]
MHFICAPKSSWLYLTLVKMVLMMTYYLAKSKPRPQTGVKFNKLSSTSSYTFFAVMESPSFILVVCLMIQCHGSSHFHYLQKGEEVTLSCGTCQWEADVDSDNTVDCILSKTRNYSNKSEGPTGKPKLCDNKEIKRSEPNVCDISIKRGFFACVNDFKSDSCFIYPFKPCAHQVESFIVAQEEPDMVSAPVMESSVNVSAGGSVNLTCIFTTKGNYSNKAFVVYWIKTGAESSTCVYSFHFDSDYNAGFDGHCSIDKDLLLRRSNATKPSLTDTNTHNLMISNATHSDSGQYVCALRVNKNQQHWTIITNTTVTVGDPVKPDVYIEANPTTTGITTVEFNPIYMTGVVVPIILIAVVIILLRRRSAGTKAPQTVIFQSYQHGEAEDDNDDCSPYAVSQREQEPMYSLIQLTEQKTDCSTSGNGELASKASGHKAIMKNNSIYETAGP